MQRSLRRGGAAVLPLILFLAGPSSAQIIETREGDANPMVSVFKSTIYGSGAGLLLGLAIEVADDDGNADAVRWGFVAGTFFGFAYGVYHVSTRPGPSALLEGRPGRWAVGVPQLEFVSRAPDVRAPGSAADTPGGLGVRVPVARLRF